MGTSYQRVPVAVCLDDGQAQVRVNLPPDRDHDRALLRQSRGLATPALASLFAQQVAMFDDVLFDHAATAGAAQLHFLDGMASVRRERDAMQAAWDAHLDRAWQALLEGCPLSADAVMAGDARGHLSLVPHHTLESRLAVRQFAAALLRTSAPLLGRLDQRLGRLANGVALDADSNPLGPEHLAVALHHALAVCELAPEVRLVLVKRCERDMQAPLQQIFLSVDAQLLAAGVLPALAASPPPARTAAPPRQRAETMLEAPTPTPTPAGSGQATAGGALRADQVQLLGSLQTLLRQARGARESATDAARAAIEQQRPLSSEEMLSLLSLLQSAPATAISNALDESSISLAERLKREVLASTPQLGVDPAQARLRADDEDAIELVGMVFDVLLDQKDLEGRPRALMERLVVPFVKVALLDRHLFAHQGHPARRLLDALAEACAGSTGEGAAERLLMGKVEEVIERLVAEFNENLAIFAVLEEEFSEFLVQHRRRVQIAERRVAETQRGQEKLEMARRRAGLELACRIDGGDLPLALRQFLQQPWQHHLTLCLLREGDDGESVTEALALADALLVELEQARTMAVVAQWDEARGLLLVRMFASIGLHGEAVERAVDALHGLMQAVAQGLPESARVLPDLPPVVLPAPPQDAATLHVQPDAAQAAFEPAEAERLRSLAAGSWLDFIGEDGKAQAAKLSWVSPISGRLLFVNRRGGRFCVASPEALAAMVAQQRLRPHVADSAFESALHQVMERLAPAAGATLH